MGNSVSIMLVAGHKLGVIFSWTAIVLCVIFVLSMMVMLGVGLGYNYCLVDLTPGYRYVPKRYIYPGSPGWPYNANETGKGTFFRSHNVTVPRLRKGTLPNKRAKIIRELILTTPTEPTTTNSLPDFNTRNLTNRVDEPKEIDVSYKLENTFRNYINGNASEENSEVNFENLVNNVSNMSLEIPLSESELKILLSHLNDSRYKDTLNFGTNKTYTVQIDFS